MPATQIPLESVVLVITAVAAVLGISGSIIAIIVFVRNSKKTSVEEGQWRQRQEDATRALNTKIDNVVEKVDSLTDAVGAVREDQKKANTRIERLCTYHTVNHAGQPL